MQRQRRGTVRARVAQVAGFISVCVAALGSTAAHAEIRIEDERFASIDVPHVPEASDLVIDVELPTLGATDLTLLVDESPLEPVESPFGATASVPAPQGPTTVTVSLLESGSPDLVVTLVDSEGRVLHTEQHRVALVGTSEPAESPEPEPTPSPGPSAPPTPHQPSAPESTGSPAPRPQEESPSPTPSEVPASEQDGDGAPLRPSGSEVTLIVLGVGAVLALGGGALMFARRKVAHRDQGGDR